MGDIASTRVRLADVAREAGVSKAAVSFAFNKPDRLSAETAARIRAVAASMGYRPHPVARMLTAGSTATIGILSPQALGTVFANPFFSLFAEGVASVTEERGFGLLFISPLHGSLARALDRATVDGIVAVGLDERHPGGGVDPPGGPARGARGRARVGGAWRRGRRRRGWRARRRGAPAAPRPPQLPGHQRRAAHVWRAAAGERRRAAHARLPGDARGRRGGARSPDVVVRAATFEGGETALLRAWEDGLRPTAVLSMSDAAAAGVVQAARVLGLRVPDDLSVVGFDDLPLTRFTDPPLTTVHQPVRRKGEEAARLLLAALSAPGRGGRAKDPGDAAGGPPFDGGSTRRSTSGGGRLPMPVQ